MYSILNLVGRMTFYNCQTTGKSLTATEIKSIMPNDHMLMQFGYWCCQCGKNFVKGQITMCDHFICYECCNLQTALIGTLETIWCKICWRRTGIIKSQ